MTHSCSTFNLWIPVERSQTRTLRSHEHETISWATAGNEIENILSSVGQRIMVTVRDKSEPVAQTRLIRMRFRPTCAYGSGLSDHRRQASFTAAKSYCNSPICSTRSTSNV